MEGWGPTVTWLNSRRARYRPADVAAWLAAQGQLERRRTRQRDNCGPHHPRDVVGFGAMTRRQIALLVAVAVLVLAAATVTRWMLTRPSGWNCPPGTIDYC